MSKALSHILTPNSLVLTATQLLTEQLSAEYPQTRILRLSQWITRLCKPSLSESQEHAVWQLIVADSVPYHSFLQQAQIATMAQQAWHLLKQWHIPLSHPAFGNTNDTRLFKQWANQFVKQCKQHQWLDASSAIESYIADIHSVPTHIILVGFTELTPQQQRLLDALSARGCKYEFWDNASDSTPKRIALADPETEWTTMARWAAEYLAQSPNSGIACVVPQLTENRLFIEDIFLKLNVPFTLSTSQALDNYPLIRCALLVLSNAQPTLQHSPFIKTPVTDETLPPAAQTPSEWSLFFSQQLNAWGWPGNRELDKNEIQLCEQWEAVLKIFETLDSILPLLSHEDALIRFQTLVSTTLFQPKNAPSAIQILTPLEAIGLSFDALWLMGIQDTTWPPAPRPNPFLPTSLQRELRMPYASAEQTLRFYRQITTTLCTHTPNVIISYALRNSEGELRPSSLIQQLPDITLADLNLADYKNPAQAIFETSQTTSPLEWIADEWAPPALSEEVRHSGSALFKDQAACPFRAFAHHRLRAKALEPTQAGLTYAERGTLIHQILETIWARLCNHTQLCNMSEPELKTFIQKCVEQTLTRFSEERSTPLKKRFQALEIQRLETLVWQWLILEKERAFFTVKAVEKKQTLQLGKYPTHIRIDRIDELSDGSHLIIDYKTGEYSDSAWYGERPDEPQVPLYCIASEYSSIGASVAQIRPGNMGFKGAISDKALDFGPKGLKPVEYWEEQIKSWEIILKNLAQQFESGYASVDPKDPPRTCQYCHLSMVCRVKEI
jgi:ATP-dependent helicase/nuclease subunit B